MNTVQKESKQFAATLTICYVILFPFVLWLSLWSAMVFLRPNMTPLVGFSIIFAYLCVPLSMLASILVMWLQYTNENYPKIYRVGAWPLLAFLLAMFTEIALQWLFL